MSSNSDQENYTNDKENINDGGTSNNIELKKGTWSSEEDKILEEYVKKHGEGNWNAIHKNTTLARCGKSCRLRWSNHLHPNLKKEPFSTEEHNKIIRLHEKFGPKWAQMTLQLPGRTDNDIKNFWNTRKRKLEKKGLPLYPQSINQEDELSDHVGESSSSGSRSQQIENVSQENNFEIPKFKKDILRGQHPSIYDKIIENDLKHISDLFPTFVEEPPKDYLKNVGMTSTSNNTIPMMIDRDGIGTSSMHEAMVPDLPPCSSGSLESTFYTMNLEGSHAGEINLIDEKGKKPISPISMEKDSEVNHSDFIDDLDCDSLFDFNSFDNDNKKYDKLPQE